MSGEIVTTTENTAVTTAKPTTFMEMIAQGMTDPNFDADKLAKLLDANERYMKTQAEIAYNEAMARLQAKLPYVIKQAKGHKERKYARFEDIDRIVRPLMREENLSASYTNNPCELEGGGIVQTVTIRHAMGHKESFDFEMPMDPGNQSMNPLQRMGSTNSYAKRYALCNALNIVTVNEDDDGAGADEVVDTAQAAEIDLLMRDADANKPKFFEYMGVKDVREIRLKDYKKAVYALKATILDKQTKKKGKENG